MIGDNKNLNDIMKIYQLRAKYKNYELNKKNKNFEEFKSVYGNVLNKNEKMPPKNVQRKMDNSLTQVDVKTIKLEMPMFGSEAAILHCQKPKIVPKRRSNFKKKVETKDEGICTRELVNNLKKMENEGVKEQKEVNKNPMAFLENTEKDLNMAAKQLEKIKEILNTRKNTEKRPKTPTYKAKKKDRHFDCVSKKYLSTLTTMRKHLQRLEEKYFSKPHLVYKSVNDTFTQSSKVEILYENNRYPEDLKIDETLRGIKNDLDNIANSEVEEEYINVTPRAISFMRPLKNDFDKENDMSYSSVNDNSEVFLRKQDLESPPRDLSFRKINYDRPDIRKVTSILDKAYSTQKNNSPRNFSFKKPVSTNDLYGTKKTSYASLIDTSESRFKKMRNMKQDIVDVEAICKGLSEIGKLSDDESEANTNLEEEKVVETVVENKESDRGLFDDSELQESVLKSSFLMKEFKITPSVKIFSETNSFVRSKNKFNEVTGKCSSSCNNSITNLIDNLNLALKNSIYKPVGI